MAAPVASPGMAPIAAAPFRRFFADAVVVVTAKADVVTIATVVTVMIDLPTMTFLTGVVDGDFDAPMTLM